MYHGQEILLRDGKTKKIVLCHEVQAYKKNERRAMKKFKLF